MKNTYILVKEGEHNEMYFFNVRDVGVFLKKNEAYVSQILSGKIKHNYVVVDTKVYYISRLPCGEKQYEMQRQLQSKIDELKTQMNCVQDNRDASCSCHQKKTKKISKKDESKNVDVGKVSNDE